TRVYFSYVYPVPPGHCRGVEDCVQRGGGPVRSPTSYTSFKETPLGAVCCRPTYGPPASMYTFSNAAIASGRYRISREYRLEGINRKQLSFLTSFACNSDTFAPASQLVAIRAAALRSAPTKNASVRLYRK